MNKFSSSKFLLLICWIISIILFFNCPENIDKIYMSYSLVNTLVATISFLFYQKKIFKKIIFISITFLFTMSMIIVHFQIGVAHVFGFQIENDSFNNFIWGDIKKGNLSIAISSLGLLSFYLGHFLASSFKTNNSYINTKFSSYKKLISLLTFFSIVFYFLFFVTSGSYMSGNYGAGDQLSISNYFSNSFYNELLARACSSFKNL